MKMCCYQKMSANRERTHDEEQNDECSQRNSICLRKDRYRVQTQREGEIRNPQLQTETVRFLLSMCRCAGNVYNYYTSQHERTHTHSLKSNNR